MSRRSRRLASAVAVVALMAPLAACGDEVGLGEPQAAGLDAVTITGEVGKFPQVDWKAHIKPGEATTKVLVEGEGEPYVKGDEAFINYIVGSGYSQKIAVNSFGPKVPAASFTVGEPTEPVDLATLIAEGVRENLPEGLKRGSRIAISVGAEQLFGGAALATEVVQSGIGNKDGLLIVADFLEPDPLEAPDGKPQKAATWAPTIVFKKGLPSGLDFTGTPEPTGKLETTLLRAGQGKKVQKGQLLVVNYLGAVYEGEKPFDESYSTEPFQPTIGVGGVVEGWDEGLVGLRVGSRVILQIPPDKGYGDSDTGDIPANSTLYFVVDILGAY